MSNVCRWSWKLLVMHIWCSCTPFSFYIRCWSCPIHRPNISCWNTLPTYPVAIQVPYSIWLFTATLHTGKPHALKLFNKHVRYRCFGRDLHQHEDLQDLLNRVGNWTPKWYLLFHLSILTCPRRDCMSYIFYSYCVKENFLGISSIDSLSLL